jgi:DNA polymerase I
MSSVTRVTRERETSYESQDVVPLLRALSEHPGELALDVETTGLDLPTLRVRTVQIAWRDPEGFHCAVISLEDESGAEDLLVVQAVSAGLPLLRQRVWTYGDFDARALQAHLGVRLNASNAMALHHLVDSFAATNANPLKTAIAKILRWETTSVSAEQTIGMSVDDEDFIRYAALDALGTLALALQWKRQVDAQEGWADHLGPWLEREARILDIARRMSDHGLLVDEAEMQRLIADTAAEGETVDAGIQGLVPGLNPRSSVQVQKALECRGVDLPTKRRKKRDGTTTYSITTSGDTLNQIDDPLAQGVARSRKLSARLTFLHEWLERRDANGRVHARFNPLGTQTSRWSSSGPNAQNIPKRGDGRQMRGGFVAPAGKVIVQADLSQIEYRVAAALSRDQGMAEAYRTEGDLHILAAKVLGGTDNPTKDDRDMAKAIGFGKLYGQTPATFARNHHLTLDEAVHRIDLYDTRFPRLREWCQEVTDFAEIHGVTPRTPYLRRFKPTGAYMAVNYVAQSTAREVFCDWLLNVADRYENRIIAVIHDEILLEVHEGEGEEAAAWCAEAASIINHEWLGEIPIVAESTVAGRRWLDAY